MKPGDFGVVATTGFVAWAIRVVTRSPYNHAYGYIGDGMIVEAQPGGAKISPLAKYDGRPQLRSQLALDPLRTVRVVRAYKEQVGIEYGFFDVAAIALSSIGIVTSKLTDDDSVFCSQLIAIGLHKGGVKFGTDKRPNRITPGDLANIILKQPVPANW